MGWQQKMTTEKSSLVLVDKNISRYAKSKLHEIGISTIDTFEIQEITDSTSTHPDMQFVKTGHKRAMVAKQAFDYYSKLLPEFELTPVCGIASPYPNDSKLNITIIGNKCLLTDFQAKFIQNNERYEPVIIRQGYSKCNICVLNDNAFITSDAGVAKIAEKAGLRAYLLPNDEISLKGYKYGFWGGCSGLIGKGQLFFNGNIETLSCYNKLMDILAKEKTDPVYYTQDLLCDTGSVVWVI